MSVNLASLVKTAFNTVGKSVQNVVKTVTYRAVTGPQTYNPTTGAVTAQTTDYAVPAILLSYVRKGKETDFQSSSRQIIEFGDQECLISYSDLPIKPTQEDTVLLDGAVWRIIDHKLDPSGTALHTFRIRQA